MPNQNFSRSGFRADINGLRAWAVIAVILYHFRIPGFSGGFIGVDIFFVISGFLMANIVIKGLEQGRFSVIEFYLARARRIVPALLGLCTVLLALGYLFLSPPDFKTLGTHVISSVGFFSNFKFWDEAGYFDVASHEKWLLHTWSLSVEWQFYLLFPLVLMGIWKCKPGRLTLLYAMLVGISISLGLSIAISNSNPSTAFFLLPTRAWEMLGGGVAFLLTSSAVFERSLGRLVEAIGLGLIALSIVIFDSSSAWPGWRAIVPVMATMLVLLANSKESIWIDNRITQWIGDRSYSLYLWHWPAVVALAFAELQHNPFAIVSGVIITFIFGNLSCRFIEIPMRRYLGLLHYKSSANLIIAATISVLLLGVVVRVLDGIGGRFNPIVEAAAAEANNINPRRDECHTTKGSTSPSCIWGGKNLDVVALGDSHSSAIVTSLAVAGNEVGAGIVQWSYSGCSFVLGLKVKPENTAALGSSYKCSEFIDWARTQLETFPSNIPVVITNRYAALAFDGNEENSDEKVPKVFFSKVYDRTSSNFLDEFGDHIIESACELAKRRTVFLMRPIPEMGFNVPKTMSRRLAFGLKGDISISIGDYRKRNDWVWAAQDVAQKQCGVKILDPLPYLCSNGRCYGSKDLRPLYNDSDHLSEFGNKLLVPMFDVVFNK